jgi:hypothetical protein
LLNYSSAKRAINVCLSAWDAFWAIQAQLKAGTLKHLEARYQKPSGGSGELTSLYFCFYLMNASSAADRRKQSASAIARQPELRGSPKSSHTENPRIF